MTKDEAIKLIDALQQTTIASYEFCNGISRRGKWESRLEKEMKAVKAIYKHLTQDEISDEDLRQFLR